jgi:fructose-bisphosphate aldolase/2-amino-3,7-dideoxy-D-threo-hept-6-ulosonate synthase
MKAMSIGKNLRMRRIMKTGRVVIVAVDHGNAAGVVRGLEDPVEVIKMAAQAGADGILVTPGVLEQAIDVVGDLAIILRIDGCVSILGSGPMELFSSVEQAVRLGVDAVVVNATVGAPHETAELEKVGTVASQGRTWGVPVLAEMLSQRMMDNHMDFSGNGDGGLPVDIASEVSLASRLGAELGADAIKTRYPGDPDSFRNIVKSTGRPILIAGGPTRGTGLESTLRLVDEVLEAGASGLVFGRTIWQYPEPMAMIRALSAMVHDDATVEEAAELAAS